MAGRLKVVFRQSGVIPLLDNRVVLITSKKSERWVIPKGHVEKGLTPAESAAKEAYEEAGLIGVVQNKEAGLYRYSKFGKLFSVQVYPLFIETILDEWDEMHDRQRKLVTPSEAMKMLCHEDLRRIIADFFQNNLY
jgi:8-oxo-dGTP pyrophosphatase MutT (NUDIX family)